MEIQTNGTSYNEKDCSSFNSPLMLLVHVFDLGFSFCPPFGCRLSPNHAGSESESVKIVWFAIYLSLSGSICCLYSWSLVFCVYQLQDIFRKSGPMCRIYLDMLVVLQKLELYGLAGATHLAALCLDNYHSLFYSFVSTVLFWFPTILI